MNGLWRLRWAVWLVFLGTAAAAAAQPAPSGAPAGWPPPVMDSALYGAVLFDRLEYRAGEGADGLRWDLLGWYGGDYHRLWVETEGEHLAGGDGEIERLDLEYGRMIAPFWDLQAGLGYQRRYGRGSDSGRFSAVAGFQGLAPYWGEVEANLRVSDEGDVSADVEVEVDLLITQRWVLQPRLETGFAAQRVEEFGVGPGFNALGAGLRLRYEIRREFAPYAGLSWSRKLGRTAELAREEGEETDALSLVAGVRMWF